MKVQICSTCPTPSDAVIGGSGYLSAVRDPAIRRDTVGCVTLADAGNSLTDPLLGPEWVMGFGSGLRPLVAQSGSDE